MRNLLPDTPSSLRRLRLVIVAVGLIAATGSLWTRAQDADPPTPGPQAVAAPTEQPPGQPQPQQQPEAKSGRPPMPTIWNLAVQGGIFMIPIGLCSVVVLAFALERYVGLRGRKIVPPKLLVALEQLKSENSGIDPRQAYEVCQTYPSPLANVIRVAILKVGRPHSELEKAVEDAVAREADEMAHNIRPINVSISISPLLGLLGTVQGMILAFMVTSTTTATGAAKGQELAQGIYIALVTTFAGLCVAIPGILLANSLEGRIERLLRDMEDVFLEILPQFERFEGKLRVTRKVGSSGVLLKGTGTTASKPAAVATNKPEAALASAPTSAVSRPDEEEIKDQQVVAEPKSLWGVMGTREKVGKDS